MLQVVNVRLNSVSLLSYLLFLRTSEYNLQLFVGSLHQEGLSYYQELFGCHKILTDFSEFGEPQHPLNVLSRICSQRY